MSHQLQHENHEGDETLTATDWEQKIRTAVDTIPDVLIRAIVIADPRLEYYSGVNDLPLRHLPDEECQEILSQVNECRPHCFDTAKYALHARLNLEIDHTESLSNSDRCKPMGELISYAANTQFVEVLDGIEAHIAICPLCGPIVALLRTVQTQRELPVPPSRRYLGKDEPAPTRYL